MHVAELTTILDNLFSGPVNTTSTPERITHHGVSFYPLITQLLYSLSER